MCPQIGRCEDCAWWVPLFTPESGLGECMKCPPSIGCRDQECEDWEPITAEAS